MDGFLVGVDAERDERLLQLIPKEYLAMENVRAAQFAGNPVCWQYFVITKPFFFAEITVFSAQKCKPKEMAAFWRLVGDASVVCALARAFTVVLGDGIARRLRIAPKFTANISHKLETRNTEYFIPRASMPKTLEEILNTAVESDESQDDDNADLQDFIEPDDASEPNEDDREVTDDALLLRLAESSCLDVLLYGKKLESGAFVPAAAAAKDEPFSPGPYEQWQIDLSDWESSPEGQAIVEREGACSDVYFYLSTKHWLGCIDAKLQQLVAKSPVVYGQIISVMRQTRQWAAHSKHAILLEKAGGIMEFRLPATITSDSPELEHIWFLANMPYAMKRCAYAWYTDNRKEIDDSFIGDALEFIRSAFVKHVGVQLKDNYDAATRWLDVELGQ